MSRSPTIDAARLELMLTELRLPAMKAMWSGIAAQSDKEGWPASRFLSCLAEHEMADRGRRRIARHLAGSSLPDGKTIDSFEFELVPMVSKAQVKALILDNVDPLPDLAGKTVTGGRLNLFRAVSAASAGGSAARAAAFNSVPAISINDVTRHEGKGDSK